MLAVAEETVSTGSQKDTPNIRSRVSKTWLDLQSFSPAFMRPTRIPQEKDRIDKQCPKLWGFGILAVPKFFAAWSGAIPRLKV